LALAPLSPLANGRDVRSSSVFLSRRACCLALSAFSLCEGCRFAPLPSPEDSPFARSSFIFAAIGGIGASDGLTASFAGTLTTYSFGLNVLALGLSDGAKTGRGFAIKFSMSDSLRGSLGVKFEASLASGASLLFVIPLLVTLILV